MLKKQAETDSKARTIEDLFWTGGFSSPKNGGVHKWGYTKIDGFMFIYVPSVN
jgi:hypothetical protein